jgi:type III pantothenate kinase
MHKFMLLAVDIGNTNIVFGAFKDDRLVGEGRVISELPVKLPKLKGKFDKAIIASVVPALTYPTAKLIEKAYGVKPIVLNWKMLKGITISVPNKDQIGIDRLVNAIAVDRLYGTPAIIIDLGTATTFCAVKKDCEYLGGAITSGLAISRDILHKRTAKLPLIKLEVPKKAVGKNTIDAMNSGLFFGYVEMIEGMIRRIRREMGGHVKVIATGGLSKLIAKGSKVFDNVDIDLTLKGISIISKETGENR